MKKMLLLLMMLCLAVTAEAAVKTVVVEYKQGDTVLEGYLAWDDATNISRPAVLVVHEWTGLGPYVKKRAEMLAELGYVAFAADIYGKGVRPATQAEAGKTAGIYKNDRSLMRARAKAGLDTLKAQKFVDPKRLAAIGYCFGGGMAPISGGLSASTEAFQLPHHRTPGTSRPRYWPCTELTTHL